MDVTHGSSLATLPIFLFATNQRYDSAHFLVFFLFLVLGSCCTSQICGFISILSKSDKSPYISSKASLALPPHPRQAAPPHPPGPCGSWMFPCFPQFQSHTLSSSPYCSSLLLQDQISQCPAPTVASPPTARTWNPFDNCFRILVPFLTGSAPACRCLRRGLRFLAPL